MQLDATTPFCPGVADKKVIRGCFHRNEMVCFSVAVALSGSVETRSMTHIRGYLLIDDIQR